MRLSIKSIFYLFLIYLLAPKIDLIKFSLSAIRIEDFVTLIAMIIFLINDGMRAVGKIPDYIRKYAIYVSICLISSVIYIFSIKLSGFVFSIRLAEYGFWALAGLAFSKHVSRKEIVFGFSVVAVVLICWGVLEYAHLIPKIGKFKAAANRLSINTTGPFEISVVLTGLIYSIENTIIIFGLLPILYLTQARSTIFAAMFAYVIRRPGRGLLMLGVAASVMLAAPSIKEGLSQTRLAETPGPVEMMEITKSLWERAPTLDNRNQYDWIIVGNSDFSQYLNYNQDVSFQIRAFRTAILLKWIFGHMGYVVFGIGPGQIGVGVDDNYLRAFGETGIIGLISFVVFLISMFRNFPVKSSTVSLLVTMTITAIFIDIFWSSKAMPLLWVISSWEHVNGSITSRKRQAIPTQLEPATLPSQGREGSFPLPTY